jgi:hypothetical protein
VIDHTLLKPDARESEIVKLCTEAHSNKFAAVCVNGCYASLALETLRNLKLAEADHQERKYSEVKVRITCFLIKIYQLFTIICILDFFLLCFD